MFRAQKQMFCRPDSPIHTRVFQTNLVQFLANLGPSAIDVALNHIYLYHYNHQGCIDLAYLCKMENYLPFELNHTTI